MFEESCQDHLAALAERAKDADAHDAPFDEKRDSAASYNPAGYSRTTIDNVLASIMSSLKKPNEEPRKFLEHFVRRLKVEWLEKQQGNVNANPGEPLLDVVHGFPAPVKALSWDGCAN